MTLDQAAIALLGRLETEELKVLSWGYVDGSFTQQEVAEHAAQVAADTEDGFVGSDLIASLESRKLLFRLQGSSERYRTRFAEGVRLFAGLRQVLHANGWEAAPRLVTDFRVDVKSRTYPRRHVSPRAAIDAIELESKRLSPIEQGSFEALLTPRGTAIALASFQVEANSQIRDAILSGEGRGVIIGAGTGTGKTRAFYHPALAQIAERLLRDEHWTQALAIYPRTVLLADQLTEACTLAQSLRAVLKGKRPIRMGAFFGQTPFSNNADWMPASWRRTGQGYVCPFLRCPDCDGEVIWLKADLVAGTERLSCLETGCRGGTLPGELALTRQSMQSQPPDLLFTSTEMLNRQITDTYSRRVFGIGQQALRTPYLALLDEAHTYSGSHGALVARLLRRWQHALGRGGRKLTWVGLSATLADAEGYFATLTGLHPNQVVGIDGVTDLVSEGSEYRLVLRSDPASGAGTLSTSIQAGMLLARILDSPIDQISGGVYPPRMFTFTDDLDVTNRMFHDVLDAEARWGDGNENMRKAPLAHFRSTALPEPDRRDIAGQNWRLCEEIGNQLTTNDRLLVSRTSSQDSGVDTVSKIVVATSSLEVGFDDSNVGAVLQHKAPRDPSSFLQRKGRAGRNRRTRPWSVVVTSDYGRDRLAFQGWEHLFDPLLKRPALPIDSRSVLKISAGYSFMEWLGKKTSIVGTTWKDLSSHPTGDSAGDNNTRKRQQEFVLILEELLHPGGLNLRDELRQHLVSSLAVSLEEADSLLWEPPRAVMTSLAPTVLRRLESRWGSYGSTRVNTDNSSGRNPIPEFVPSSLFADLNMPEVHVLFEVNQPDQDSIMIENVPYKEQWMPIEQALAESPVGRVTRRFSPHRARSAHWVSPNQYVDHDFEIDPSFQGEPIGTFQFLGGDNEVFEVQAQRLRTVRLSLTPSDVKHSSNAQADWKTQIFVEGSGDAGDIPSSGPFSSLIRQVRFHTHNNNSPVSVRRFSIGSTATTRHGTRPVQEDRLQVAYRHDDLPVALGYELTVDGVLFAVTITDEHIAMAMSGDSLRVLRSNIFKHRLLTDPILDGLANPFLLDWSAQLVTAMLIARSARTGRSMAEAAAMYDSEDDWSKFIHTAVVTIFQIPGQSAGDPYDDNDDSGTPPATAPDRSLLAKMLSLASQQAFRDQVIRHATVLWEEPDATWHSFVRTQVKTTLAAALMRACGEAVENSDPDMLVVDIDPGPIPPQAKNQLAEGEEAIWVSESSLGGGGAIEQIQRAYTRDPRRFYLLAESALLPGDLEEADLNLGIAVRMAVEDDEVGAALAGVRLSENFEELHSCLALLRGVLNRKWILVTHPFSVSLNARILRPSTNRSTDALTLKLLRLWEESELEWQIEVDARVFAYLCSIDDSIATDLSTFLSTLGSGPVTKEKLFTVLYGAIWPRGAAVRRPALEFYNRFYQGPPPDPIFLRGLFSSSDRIDILQEGWRQRVEGRLRSAGVARLFGSHEDHEALLDGLFGFLTQPFDAGILTVYAYVARVQRTVDGYEALLHLREAIQ